MTQCSSLLRLIGGRFPRFKSEPSNERWRDLDEQRELKAFRASLAFVLSLKRTVEPVVKYSASWWVDQAQEFARRAGLPSANMIGSILPAIIATASVPFTLDSNSTVWLGYSGSTIDPAGWKRALSGSLLEPVPAQRPPFQHQVVRVGQEPRIW